MAKNSCWFLYSRCSRRPWKRIRSSNKKVCRKTVTNCTCKNKKKLKRRICKGNNHGYKLTVYLNVISKLSCNSINSLLNSLLLKNQSVMIWGNNSFTWGLPKQTSPTEKLRRRLWSSESIDKLKIWSKWRNNTTTIPIKLKDSWAKPKKPFRKCKTKLEMGKALKKAHQKQKPMYAHTRCIWRIKQQIN